MKRATRRTILNGAIGLFGFSLVTLQAIGDTLWYSGDFDGRYGYVNRIDTSGRSSVPIAEMFERFDVTDASGWNITAIWSDNNFGTSEPRADWSIRVGMGLNAGGTTLFSGTSPLTVTPTGRYSVPVSGSATNWEYQLEVTGLNVYLPQGEYWLNVTPYSPNTTSISSTVGSNAVGTPSGSADPGLWWWSIGYHNYDYPGPGFSMGVAGTVAIPEPSSLLLAGSGAMLLWALLRRRRT
ncbi:MAG: PEP-CTERM sorting domain-containing protein [Verrucomicrobiia bacterium]